MIHLPILKQNWTWFRNRKMILKRRKFVWKNKPVCSIGNSFSKNITEKEWKIWNKLYKNSLNLIPFSSYFKKKRDLNHSKNKIKENYFSKSWKNKSNKLNNKNAKPDLWILKSIELIILCSIMIEFIQQLFLLEWLMITKLKNKKFWYKNF